MSSPESNPIKPGELVEVRHSHAGRTYGWVMHNSGEEVFVRAFLKFNPAGRQVTLHQPPYLEVPVHFPGLKRMKPSQALAQPQPQKQNLPNF